MNYNDNFGQIEKKLGIAQHLLYLANSVFEDKKIFLRILPEIKEAVVKTLNLILYYEATQKRIKLSKDPKNNFEIFKKKCSANYHITLQEIRKIEEIFRINERQKRSTMDFIRDEKVVIFMENQEYEILTSNKINEFIEVAREILQKTKNKIENFHS
jgi:hypothetical protein